MAGSVYNPETGIYTSARPGVKLPPPTTGLVQFFLHNTSAPELSTKVALRDASSGERVTYSELKHRVSTIASGLLQLGVRKGDVVLILCPNSIQFVETFLAVVSIEAILTTVNPLNTAQEIAKQAKDSSPVLVFTTPDLLHKVADLQLPVVLVDSSAEIRNSHSNFQKVSPLQPSPVTPYARLLEAGTRTVAACPSIDDTAALLYSSGTTGVSKGVMLSHRNFIAVALQVNVDAKLEERKDDVILCMLPMFHIFGLAVIIYGSLQRGETVVILPKFEFVEMLKCIQEFKVTQLPLVPPVVIALAKSSAVNDYDLSTLKNVISGAAPLGKEIMLECSKRLPFLDLRQGYGLTESSGMSLLMNSREDLRFLGTAGTLVAGTEAKVVDPETGKSLPPNSEGELWLRGPHIMKGYLNNPEATASTLDKDGWLHTGDLVYVNEGRIYVMDRMKELIKYKGFQVAPAELEALLLSHPMVLDAAVVPLPDDEAGEVPIAYVVKKANVNVDESNILKFVADQVAPYKRLKRVYFIETIPKSAAGKILRRELKTLPSKL